MPDALTHVFRVDTIDAKISDRYTSLGWFFDDDQNNPLIFPAGLFHIDATREPTLHIEYRPDTISVEGIRAYLASLGISTTALGDYVLSWKERVLQIILYPFAALFAGIIMLFLKIWDYRQRKNTRQQ